MHHLGIEVEFYWLASQSFLFSIAFGVQVADVTRWMAPYHSTRDANSQTKNEER